MLSQPPPPYSPPSTLSYPLLASPPLPYYPPLLGTLSLSLPPASFIFAASPLLFQPRNSCIVLVHDTPSGTYFLPRGRKDIGESLSTCALREGFEESGFRGELISWGSGSGGTLQPRPPKSSKDNSTPEIENKEAFWVQAQPVATRRGIITYFTYYFLAVLPEDNPVPDKGKERLVGQHESGYEGVLVPIEEAIKLLSRDNNSRGDSLVFVADEDKVPDVQELIDLGKIWKVGPGGEENDGDKDDPAWEDDNETNNTGKLGPIRYSDTYRIEKGTANILVREGKGRLVPWQAHGGDDGVVQASVVYEAWKRLKEVYEWK